MAITREILENGNVLRALVEQFNNNRNEQFLLAVLNCLRDSYIWIPCNAVISDEDKKKFVNSKKGDTVNTENDVRLVPDILQSGDLFFFPVFSNIEQMGEEYGSHFSKVQKHFFEAMSMARDNVKGIVLDAFTQPFVVDKELFDFIGNLPTKIEE